MKDQILAIAAKVKQFIIDESKVSPLVVGVIVGYVGHPVIALGLNIIGSVVKAVLHII